MYLWVKKPNYDPEIVGLLETYGFDFKIIERPKLFNIIR